MRSQEEQIKAILATFPQCFELGEFADTLGILVGVVAEASGHGDAATDVVIKGIKAHIQDGRTLQRLSKLLR